MTTNFPQPPSPQPGPPPPPAPGPEPGPGPTNPIPPPDPGRSRYRALLAALLAVATAACGGAEPPPAQTPAPAAAPAEAPPVSQRYVGCISTTVQPGTFVLSVEEGRDFTTGQPPGTAVPQQGDLPPGAPPPVPPVTATTGTPGGGATPTTKIVTYTLVGDAGADLGAHVGHTVEVVGTPMPHDTAKGSTSASLQVVSFKMVADVCK